MGAIEQDQLLTGNPDGIDEEIIPGLTKDKSNRINDWSDEDILLSLEIGMIPDGDFLGGSMGDVIENTTSKLTEPDRKAIVEYLKNH